MISWYHEFIFSSRPVGQYGVKVVSPSPPTSTRVTDGKPPSKEHTVVFQDEQKEKEKENKEEELTWEEVARVDFFSHSFFHFRSYNACKEDDKYTTI